jgi:hypothetical protein
VGGPYGAVLETGSEEKARKLSEIVTRMSLGSVECQASIFMKSKNLTVGELKANHLQPVDAISVRDTCKQLLIALRLTDKQPCGTCTT